MISKFEHNKPESLVDWTIPADEGTGSKEDEIENWKAKGRSALGDRAGNQTT